MTCQIYVDLDYDGAKAEFYVTKMVKARKAHECLECKRKIKSGEMYERVKAKWDGQIDTICTCSTCLEIRKAFFCTYVHGSMWVDFEYEAVEEDLDLSKLEGLSKAAIDAVSEHL